MTCDACEEIVRTVAARPPMHTDTAGMTWCLHCGVALPPEGEWTVLGHYPGCVWRLAVVHIASKAVYGSEHQFGG